MIQALPHHTACQNLNHFTIPYYSGNKGRIFLPTSSYTFPRTMPQGLLTTLKVQSPHVFLYFIPITSLQKWPPPLKLLKVVTSLIPNPPQFIGEHTRFQSIKWNLIFPSSKPSRSNFPHIVSYKGYLFSSNAITNESNKQGV